MKYHQILTLLTREPLLITPDAQRSLLSLFKQHASLGPDDFRSAREGVDICGQKVELEQMEIIEGIAHIPIGGPIGRGLGKFEKGAGAVDVGDIEDDLNVAEDSSEVRAAILDIDSPGGMVSGTAELADRILQFEKPIYAYTAGMMCSAAYWLGCACDMMFATRTAAIGCIGAYMVFYDETKADEMAGIKTQVISSGKYKGMGVPGTSLSRDQAQLLQDRINEINQMFQSHVTSMRPDISAEDMQGQYFRADMALAKGFIDQIVQSKDDVVDLLS